MSAPSDEEAKLIALFDEHVAKIKAAPLFFRLDHASTEGQRAAALRELEEILLRKLAVARARRSPEVSRIDVEERGRPQPEVRRPGRKSRWRRSALEAITKRIANGDSLHSIAADVGIRHQRISELRQRGDVYWDKTDGRLVTPPGTVREGGFVILPPAR
jgi:hypothetical protein